MLPKNKDLAPSFDLWLFIGTIPVTGEETVVYVDSISVTLIPIAGAGSWE